MNINLIQQEWKKMTAALNADFYRIQGQGYTPTPAINFCRAYGSDAEVLWSMDTVSAQLCRLKQKNDSGNYNIYCCPIRTDVGYILIDDVNTDVKRTGLELEYGLPAVILQSSADNYQHIYKVRIPGLDIAVDRFHSTARRAGNEIVKKINNKYGDPKISGIYHQFRIPGFKNIKPGRNNFFCLLHHAEDIYNDKIAYEIAAEILKQDRQVQPRVLNVRNYPDNIVSSAPQDQAGMEYLRYFRRSEGLARSKGWILDASICDFNACKAMLSAGYSTEDTVLALIDASPRLQIRHPQQCIYAVETVNAAASALSGLLEEKKREESVSALAPSSSLSFVDGGNR